MPVCFIISPIGESGSEIRRNADDLRDLIIIPALEPYGFTVIRGDHRSEAGQIDIDVIRAVQESELCVIDISIHNANVFYEFGRRDETGKPLILLKSKDSDEMPVDIATRRYVEYDLDSRRGIIDAREQLKNFVEPIVKRGFESNGTGASLSEIAELLRRIERKVDRISSTGSGSNITPGISPGIDNDDQLDKVDPTDLIKLALTQRNIPLAERAMKQLSYRMDKFRWLDQIVEPVAAIGSKEAGDILLENAMEFMDRSASSFKDKIDYLGCLVSNLTRTSRELNNIQLVEEICNILKAASENEPPRLRIQIYNQLNRINFGIYQETDDTEYLEKAIKNLQDAIAICDEADFLHFNLAMCLQKRGQENDKQEALSHVLYAIELEGDKPDDDHLELVCNLLYELNDERLQDYMAMLGKVNPVKLRLMQSRWRS